MSTQGPGLLEGAASIAAAGVGLEPRLAFAVDPHLARPLAGCSRGRPVRESAPKCLARRVVQ
jgi:hypothetical protein